MSQRTEKVASLVQQTVAQALIEHLGSESAAVTVTAVDVAPDLKSATIWLGLMAPARRHEQIMAQVQEARNDIQASVARTLTTKYVPRLSFRQDASGDYAQHIEAIIRKL